MKVVKNINNNVAVCVTSTGVEVVAFGKGLGFIKPPQEVELSRIERTFYDVDEAYIQMINEIPEKVLDISARVIDYARTVIDSPISSNVVFTLADHIHFALKRSKMNMTVKLPVLYDVEHLMEKETQVGKRALWLLRREMKVYLPQEEAACIAMHVFNAEAANEKGALAKDDEGIIEDIACIIEAYFHTRVDRSGYNYSRYAMHVRYLIRRGRENQMIEKGDPSLYDTLCEAIPETKKCVEQVAQYLKKALGCELTKEEFMYLMLHTNRLCDREDCKEL